MNNQTYTITSSNPEPDGVSFYATVTPPLHGRSEVIYTERREGKYIHKEIYCPATSAFLAGGTLEENGYNRVYVRATGTSVKQQIYDILANTLDVTEDWTIHDVEIQTSERGVFLYGMRAATERLAELITTVVNERGGNSDGIADGTAVFGRTNQPLYEHEAERMTAEQVTKGVMSLFGEV